MQLEPSALSHKLLRVFMPQASVSTVSPSLPLTTRFGQRSLPAKLLTRSMEYLDENKLRELIITDTLLMVLPRTAIEGTLRDAKARWDAIREVLMREILSTVAMVFVMPVIGQGVSKVFDRLPAINKRGLFTGAWINEYVLRRAMQHYEATLKAMAKAQGTDGLKPELVRQQVISRLLNDLETGDQTLLNGLKSTLKSADLVKQVLPHKTEAIAQLTPKFALNRQHPEAGIFPIDDTVKQLQAIQKRLGHPADFTLDKKAFALRLGESVKDLQSGKTWMKAVDAILSQRQFGDRLSFSINDQTRRVMTREEVMMSLRHFVQHILDRSLVEVGTKNGLVSADKLRAIADDFATHTHKSKNWITWLPFLIALVGGRSVPAIINGISRVLHGGKQYFPGDVALIESEFKAPVKLLAHGPNNQVFAGFAGMGVKP